MLLKQIINFSALATVLILGTSCNNSSGSKSSKPNINLGGTPTPTLTPTPSPTPTPTPIAKFYVGGTITGLKLSGLVLQNLGTDDLIVPANADEFQFTTKVETNQGYNVTIMNQPDFSFCTLNNNTATAITSDVNSIQLTCVRLPGRLDSVVVANGMTTLNGENLDWLGNDGTSYKVANNFFSPPVEGGLIGGYSSGNYTPGYTSATLSSGLSSPIYLYLCPVASTHYESSICTNMIRYP